MHDHIVRAITGDGYVNAISITSREIVECARNMHKTLPTATAALGRLLSAAAMMGNMQKVEDGSITLQIKGGGPLGTLLAVSDAQGNVRGWVENPQISMLEKYRGKLDVGAAVGNDGMLTVIRDLRMKDPYVGSVELVSGEIAEDITSYYAYSEQVPTVCALGVLVDKDLSISCAGGYLLQLLPGATDAEITQLEQNIAAMPSVTEMLHAGKTTEDMMNLAMAGFNPSVLDEREVRYQCDCSRERTEQMLLSLGRKELEKLRDEDPHCEVVCHFCHTKYEFDLNKLVKKAVEKATPASENAEN